MVGRAKAKTRLRGRKGRAMVQGAGSVGIFRLRSSLRPTNFAQDDDFVVIRRANPEILPLRVAQGQNDEV